MRPENQRMSVFLLAHGIKATPKYIAAGSLRGCWRLFARGRRWDDLVCESLTRLGFRDYNNKPLSQYSGNGGVFQVLVRGHNEFLDE